MIEKRCIHVICVLIILAAGVIGAQGQYVSNRIPYQTFVGTENITLNLASSPTTAFQPINVTCPSAPSTGCTMVVRVSSQFQAQYCCDWGAFYMHADISGPGSQVWPNPEVRVGNGGGMGMGQNMMANAETFQWMKSGISAGSNQTVSITFHTDGFNGVAGYRTVVVDVYRNP